ncbi:MAG: AAA family ATPase [Promethearchaeota archaeon]
MLIKRIELENISTHKHTAIDFEEGLNILLGQNGTGKSTILKMIGYILFDYLPDTQMSYVRADRGKKITHGIIKLWIVGLNDDIYIIKRTIGKSRNTIEVQDGRSGLPISKINDKSGLLTWLRTQFSLKGTIDLSTLFETSIGIPQGTFCEPFLRTPAQRKNFFNPILQVDVYRKVWEKLRELIKEFSGDIEKIDFYIDTLSEFLLKKEDLLSENEKIELELNENQKSLEKCEKELDNVSQEADQLKLIKEERDKLISETSQLFVKKESLLNSMDELKRQIEEARKACKTCKDTKKDHLKYLTLIEKQEKLEKRHAELEEKKNRHQELREQLTRINGILEEKEKEKKTIENSRDKFTKLEKIKEKKEKLRLEIEKLRTELTLISTSEEQLSELRKKYSELSKEIYEYEKTIRKENEWKESLEKLEQLERNLENHTREKILLEANLNQLIEYENISKNNTCPFLNEPCKNIRDTPLETIFQVKILKIKESILLVDQKIDLVNKEIKKLEAVREQIEALKIIKTKYKEIKTRREEIIEKINNQKEIVDGKKSFQEKLNALELEKKDLEEQLKEYHVLKNLIENELPSLITTIKNLEKKKAPLSKELAFLEKQLKEFQTLSSELTKIKKDLQKTRNMHELYQKNEHLATKLPEFEENFKVKEREHEKLETLLYDKIALKEEFDAKFNEIKFKHLEEKKEELIEKKSILKTTIENLKKNQSKIEVELKELNEKEEELKEFKKIREWYSFLEKLIGDIRTWFNEAGPKITKALLNQINNTASQLYRELMNDDSLKLIWEEDFNIHLISPENEKSYSQLSGGEQMAAALAVRLAILKTLTNIDFAFFDEPTTNLDSEKRINLAQCIQNLKGFKQLFVISHDDTFEEIADNVIKFTKDQNETTQVQFLTK